MAMRESVHEIIYESNWPTWSVRSCWQTVGQTDGWSGRGCFATHGQVWSSRRDFQCKIGYSNVQSSSLLIYPRLKLNLDAHNKSYSITLCRTSPCMQCTCTASGLFTKRVMVTRACACWVGRERSYTRARRALAACTTRAPGQCNEKQYRVLARIGFHSDTVEYRRHGH